MSPRRLLRRYVPDSDRSFVAFGERIFDRVASIAAMPWPQPEQEAARISRIERALRRRFPWATIELDGPGASLVVSRDGGRTQTEW